MKFIKTDNTDDIQRLRTQLYQELTAPMDAMWELLYIASAQHYLIDTDHETMGYCCINDEGSLLQLFLLDRFKANTNQVITTLIETDLICSASLSSNEPLSFNACLANSKAIATNTFCFEHFNKPVNIDSNLNLELVLADNISAIKAFLLEQLGMHDTFGYTENLVSRKEIFMVKEGDVIIATSECRMSDTQPNIADIGIVVNKNNQGKGIATHIMGMQVNRVLAANRKPICSTTVDNIASRRAIEKAGFYCSNVIFDIRLTKDKS